MPLLHYCEKYSLKQGIVSCVHNSMTTYINISSVHAYVNQCLVVTISMPMYINILCSCLHISILCHAYVYLPTITAVVSCYLSQQQEATQRPIGTGDHPNSTGWVIMTDCYFTHYSANKRDLFHYLLAWNHHVSRWMFKQSPVTC